LSRFEGLPGVVKSLLLQNFGGRTFETLYHLPAFSLCADSQRRRAGRVFLMPEAVHPKGGFVVGLFRDSTNERHFLKAARLIAFPTAQYRKQFPGGIISRRITLNDSIGGKFDPAHFAIDPVWPGILYEYSLGLML